MTDFIPYENNIIKMPDLDYEPSPYGIGYELFYGMKDNKQLLAQVDAETGENDTYDQLLQRCIRAAIKLKDHITSDDIICICSYNHLNSCVPYLAGLFLGAKVCCLDPSQSFNDSKHLLSQIKPKMIFVVAEKEDMYQEMLRSMSFNTELVVFGKEKANSFQKFLQESADEINFVPKKVNSVYDTAAILFSSGTTGLAKGICLNHFGLLSQAKNFINFKFNTKRCLLISSMYWISSVFILIQSIFEGNARVLSKSPTAGDVLKYIVKFKVTFTFIAPHLAMSMFKEAKPYIPYLSSLHSILVSGSPISPQSILTFRDLLPDTIIGQAYGQTEIAGAATVFKPASKNDMILLGKKPGSCGRPIPGLWYKIVDLESEEVLGFNRTGELRIKTKFQLNGYHNMSSSETWASDGWLRTGDVCYYDEDFCFYVVDRIKEMLKFRSWHIAPASLECILHEHAAVKAAVVVGVPHEEDGDHPLAAVLLADDAEDVTSEELVKYVNARVDDDRHKLRGGVVFVDAIPYTPSGKIKRKLLREKILNELHR